MKNGKIKYHKVGKLVRFDKDDIDRSLGFINRDIIVKNG